MIYFVQYLTVGFTVISLFILIINKRFFYTEDFSVAIKNQYLKLVINILASISILLAIIGFMSGCCFDDIYIFILYVIMIIQLDYLYFNDKRKSNNI